MQKSCVSRFKSPVFAIKHVHMGNQSIVLALPDADYEVVCTPSRQRKVYHYLQRLTELPPDKINDILASATGEKKEIISQLDSIGAIIDKHPEDRRRPNQEFRQYILTCRKQFAELFTKINRCDVLDWSVMKPESDENFIAGALSVYINHLKHTSPLAYLLAYYCINCAHGGAPYDEKMTYDEILSLHQTGIYNLHDVYCQMGALVRLIEEVIAGKMSYLMPKAPVISEPVTGNNFILLAERYIQEALSKVGENSLVHMLNEGVANLQAAKLWYLNQYFVTKRYAPTVTAILTATLSDAIRQLLQEYFSEEVGHEGLEYQSCLALGLTPNEIESYVPLPYHVLFTDMLSVLSSNDALAYFAALYLVEGLGGEESISMKFYSHRDINQYLRLVGNEHDELNEEYNHHHLPRLLASHIHVISPDKAMRSLNYLRLMLEVSYRSSEALYHEIIK